MSEEKLLRVRLKDLKVTGEGTWRARCVRQLHPEVDERGIRFKPHVWFSTDWFSPDGVPGIAIPFFLGHPRLLRLERRMLGEAEGRSNRED